MPDIAGISGDYLIAIQEDCPVCGSLETFPCYTKGENIATKPHKARLRMAKYIKQDVESPVDSELEDV